MMSETHRRTIILKYSCRAALTMRCQEISRRTAAEEFRFHRIAGPARPAERLDRQQAQRPDQRPVQRLELVLRLGAQRGVRVVERRVAVLVLVRRPGVGLVAALAAIRLQMNATTS